LKEQADALSVLLPTQLLLLLLLLLAMMMSGQSHSTLILTCPWSSAARVMSLLVASMTKRSRLSITTSLQTVQGTKQSSTHA
jgi:hypothetical protein